MATIQVSTLLLLALAAFTNLVQASAETEDDQTLYSAKIYFDGRQPEVLVDRLGPPSDSLRIQTGDPVATPYKFIGAYGNVKYHTQVSPKKRTLISFCSHRLPFLMTPVADKDSYTPSSVEQPWLTVGPFCWQLIATIPHSLTLQTFSSMAFQTSASLISWTITRR